MFCQNQDDDIINLIRESLVLFKHSFDPDVLNLDDAKSHHLELAKMIFERIGFRKGEYSNMIFEMVYLSHAEKVKHIDLATSSDKLDALTKNIYDELLNAKDFGNQLLDML